MMDILSGVLSGGAFGTDVNGPYVADKQSGPVILPLILHKYASWTRSKQIWDS